VQTDDIATLQARLEAIEDTAERALSLARSLQHELDRARARPHPRGQK
jgi:uncharacterized protein YggE